MTAMEREDYELGQLISQLSRITYETIEDYGEFVSIYETLTPILTSVQRDAFQIVIDLMDDQRREDVAC